MAAVARNLPVPEPAPAGRPRLRVHRGGASAASPPELLEPGTRVVLMFRGSPRYGTVMPYDRQWSNGAFPVRFDDAQWLRMDADLVAVAR